MAEKIDEANRLVRIGLKQHEQPVVCWSGGKDSTVVLHLVLQHVPDVAVIYVDTGVDFPESREFVGRIARKWKLCLTAARPKRQETFWAIGKKYGWPILGKNVASDVERGVRTGNRRVQLTELERRLVEGGARISAKCTEYLQERPSKRIEERLGADLKIIGLRAEESRARVRLWVDHGDHYFVKRYFGRNRGMWKLNPIATWTEEDVWEYHACFNLPHCTLYDLGYPRNGCWTCAMAARNGQLARLRIYHRRLFRRLITGTAMGSELLRVKAILQGKRPRSHYRPQELGAYLRHNPYAFDCF